MSVSTMELRRVSLADFALPSAALLFIFSGFYKGLIDSPLDLTVMAAGLTCASLTMFIRDIDAHHHAATWLLAALAGYLALRLLPDLPAWGTRKLAELVLFGAPAFLAGYVIAKRDDALQFMLSALSYAAVPMAVVMAAFAAANDPYSYSWIGSSGYQLCGICMGLALIAATISNRYVCFGFAALGIAVAGSLAAALFTPPAVALIWWTRRKLIIKPVVAALTLLAIYTALVAPPLVVMRVLWKVGAVENAIVLGDKAPRYGNSLLTGAVLKLMPKDAQRSLVDNVAADRFDIFADAVKKFFEAPLFGHGYGSLDYLGNKYPHNVLLEMLAEGGLIAGILLILTIFATRPPLDEDAGAYAAASLLLLIGAAMVGGYWGNRILFLFLGMAIGRR